MVIVLFSVWTILIQCIDIASSFSQQTSKNVFFLVSSWMFLLWVFEQVEIETCRKKLLKSKIPLNLLSSHLQDPLGKVN